MTQQGGGSGVGLPVGGALAGSLPNPTLSGVGVPAELGYVETIVSQTGIGTSLTDLTSLSLAVTVGTRPIMVECFLPLLQPSVAAARLEVWLIDVTAGATIQLTYVTDSSTAGSFCVARARVNPAAGSRAYKVQALAETGTMTAFADANSRKWFRVTEV